MAKYTQYIGDSYSVMLTLFQWEENSNDVKLEELQNETIFCIHLDIKTAQNYFSKLRLY